MRHDFSLDIHYVLAAHQYLPCAYSVHATPIGTRQTLAPKAEGQRTMTDQQFLHMKSAACKNAYCKSGKPVTVVGTYPRYGSKRSWVDKVCVLAPDTQLLLNHLQKGCIRLAQ